MLRVARKLCAACVLWSTKLLDDFVFSFERRVETYHRLAERSNRNTDCYNRTTPFNRAMPNPLAPTL
jgi:hypothetical protein